MDQGKLALMADKTMDFLVIIAFIALVIMTAIEIYKRGNAYRIKCLIAKEAKIIHLWCIENKNRFRGSK